MSARYFDEWFSARQSDPCNEGKSLEQVKAEYFRDAVATGRTVEEAERDHLASMRRRFEAGP